MGRRFLNYASFHFQKAVFVDLIQHMAFDF